ncbi:GH32 C-terminal domain-containing protein [Butyrivibrio sp. AE3004]|uniref:GH32 C-terminal domain-containing protein n=1 Tax=Butyrivibrio sp. AE3004 TaxID=1506994 RepID=UPI002E8DF2E1|nr:GH32 C-terminal domain-containing protein [Butyrivibrio sp. AE3004]
MLAIIGPVVYIIIAFFMDPITLQNKGIVFDISKWTLTAYERVMTNPQIWTGFGNAVLYSVLFSVISVFITLLDRYSMELFINDGEQVMSMGVFTDIKADGISFKTNGELAMDVIMHELRKNDAKI